MRIQKKTILCSIVVLIIVFFLSAFLEFRIINNVCNIRFLIGHRDFVINCLIGVEASAFITFVISLVSYYTEKRKNINSYFDLLLEIYCINDYYTRWLKQYNKDGNLSIPEKDFDIFENILKHLLSALSNSVKIGSSYSPIFFYTYRINIFKKWQKKNSKLIFWQYKFNRDCLEVYLQAKLTYELWIRTILKDQPIEDKEKFSNNFQSNFRKLIHMLDKNSTFEKDQKCFSKSINKYLGIKEEHTNDNSSMHE